MLAFGAALLMIGFYSHAHTGVIGIRNRTTGAGWFLLTRPYGRDHAAVQLAQAGTGFYSHAHTGVISLVSTWMRVLLVSTHTPIRA